MNVLNFLNSKDWSLLRKTAMSAEFALFPLDSATIALATSCKI
ncbi:hypothetical protein SAMN02745702_00398 [Desulfobaculum bizertense DSM 18034]|uniref:Uncharacterized protein n=1 Tax=Desulfobaculum bizertense DSM 18034 TaxID=1121442 RepID=A0A1T4VIH8_9BACT|nr:hypothetical protein SAMN02745702_00398 [Desulfobaculum bizertense DSM 18034]